MFTTIFSAINDAKQLQNVANEIVKSIKTAYEIRAKELAGTSVNAVTPTEQAATDVKTSATAKAKAIAAKIKSAPKSDVAEVKAQSSKSDDVQIAITDKAAIKKLGLTFEPYNEKCWVLRGDTKPIRSALKEFHGVFNSRLNGGEGWVFRNDVVSEVAKSLNLKVKVA